VTPLDPKTGDMLIAAPWRWDEACFAVPAVRALIHSGLRVGILCREEQLPLWATLEHAAPITYPEDTRPRHLAPRLAGRWEAAIAWEAEVAAEAIAKAKIPRRIGPDEKPLSRLLTHPVAPLTKPGPVTHRVRHYLGVVESLGVSMARPEFFAPADLGIRQQPDSVLLCPDSDFGSSHEWPLERWLLTAKALLASSRSLTVAGLPGGNALGRALAARMPEGTPFLSARPMGEMLPRLAAQQVMIAADGSLPHLAAHVGTTCVTLFGPNDPQWKRPLGRRHAWVSRHAECAPCFLDHCPLDQRCQEELETRRVWAAMRQVFDVTDSLTQ
jgi:ADP-heptose:LPS heptosyltransferase